MHPIDLLHPAKRSSEFIELVFDKLSRTKNLQDKSLREKQQAIIETHLEQSAVGVTV